MSDYESMVQDPKTGAWVLPSSRSNGHAEPTPIRPQASPKPKETREQIVSRLRLARISPQEIAALTAMHGPCRRRCDQEGNTLATCWWTLRPSGCKSPPICDRPPHGCSHSGRVRTRSESR